MARQRISFYMSSVLLAMAWTWWVGKDMPWDALHYHLYAGYSVFNDRLALDYFPAGPQTYFTPYSYAPLYLMVQAGWPSLAIGLTLATFHATALWLIWEIARTVSGHPSDNGPALVAWAAAALALVNPVFLQELGSSFNDITTGVVALAGYLALVKAFHGGRLGMVALGGFLLGAAAALKMSNALFALMPALPLVLGCVVGIRARGTALMLFALCAGGAMVVFGGPWAWKLWQTFGNPLFPMLDSVFNPQPTAGGATPPASAASRLFGALNAIRDPRFLPDSFAEALTRPFEMLVARRGIHTETLAADVRYAALMLLPLLWLGIVCGRERDSNVAEPAERRAWVYLTASFAIAWAAWLFISGNSRYFLPMSCIAGVVLAQGISAAFSRKRHVRNLALATVLGIQVLLLATAAEFRWSPRPWGGTWVQASVPARFQQQPFLYLSIDSQSQSFLLPSLASGSALVGLGGGIGPDGRDGRRVHALIAENAPRLRMFKLVQAIESDGRPVAPAAASFDYPLRRFGLKVNTSDCSYISYKGNPAVIERSGPRSGPRDDVYVYTCSVEPGGALSEAELEGKRVADQVLDRVADSCPELFVGHRGDSFRSGSIWRRNYADVAIWVNDDGWVRFADLLRGGGDISSLGSVTEWIKSPPPLKCWRSGGHVYVERVKH